MKKLLLTLCATMVLLALLVVPAFAESADPVTITFDPDGGTLDQSLTTMQMTPGEAYTNLPVPEMERYGFAGWYRQVERYDEDLDLMVPDFVPVLEGDICDLTEDTTFYADWEQNEFSLTFYAFKDRSETDFGSPVYQMTFKKDEPTRLPAAEEFTLAIPEGYVFDGWYQDLSYDNAFVFGDVLEDDEEIFAGLFKEDEYITYLGFDIAFPRVGDEVGIETVDGEEVQTNLPEVTVWNDVYVETEIYYGYPNYTPSEFYSAETWEEMDEMLNNMMFSGTFEEGEEYIFGISVRTVVPDGQDNETITGYFAPDSELTVRVNGETVAYEPGSWSERTSRTFYFRFKPVTTHTISFVTGTDETIEPIVFYEDEVIPEVVPTLEREGYQFMGWIKDPQNKDSFFNRLNPPKRDITVYALWAKVIDGLDIVVTGLPKVGDEVTVTDNLPDVFPRATLTAFCGEEEVDESNLRYSAVYTVLPEGEEEPYQLFEGTFEENGQYFIHIFAHTLGSYDSESDTLYIFGPDKETEYYVNGWRAENYYVDEVEQEFFLDFYYPFTPAVNHPVTLTFDPDGGELDGPDTLVVTPGELYGELPVPTREEYRFSYWYSEKEVYDAEKDRYTTRYFYDYYEDDVCVLTEDTTLHAVWDQTVFYLNFYAFLSEDDIYDEEGNFRTDAYVYQMKFNEGEVTRAPSADEFELEIPEGYIFEGWYYSPFYFEEYEFGKELSSNGSVFACLLKTDEIIHSIDFDVTLPKAGDSTEFVETEITEDDYTYTETKQTNLPVVLLTNDCGVDIRIASVAFVTCIPSECDEDENEYFEGTFEEGKEYILNINLSTRFFSEDAKPFYFYSTGSFASRDDLSLTLNGSEFDYETSEWYARQYLSLYFKFTPVPVSKVEVDATESGLVVSVPEKEQEKILEDVAKQLDQTDADYGIDVVITVADHEATADEKAAFEKAAGDRKVALYLDIDITAIVNGVEYEVSELDEKITITVSLPEDLQGKDYDFVVIRDHEGKMEVIPATLSKDGKSLSFKSDKFSTYAIAYAVTASETENAGETETVAKTDGPAVETSGDLCLVAFPMLLAAAVTVIFVTKRSRKEQD